MISATPNVYTVKVSFVGVNPLTDTILTLDSATYGAPGVGLPIGSLPSTDSSFWIQEDTDGVMQLCTTKSTGRRMNMTYLAGGVGPIRNKTAANFAPQFTNEHGLVWLPVAQL